MNFIEFGDQKDLINLDKIICIEKNIDSNCQQYEIRLNLLHGNGNSKLVIIESQSDITQLERRWNFIKERVGL